MKHVSWLVGIVWIAGCGSDGPTTPSAPPIPDYGGQWAGEYTVTSCVGTGIFADPPRYCDSIQIGAAVPMRLTLTVIGTQVSGSATFGNVAIPVAGVIGNEGQLLLDGSGGIVQNIPMTATLTGWRTVASGTSMTGSWSTIWTTTLGAGSATTGQAIRVLNKTS